ncbi:hypothetical protein JTB14_010382 [Gonioctena quinquepunctata]|nr:hypothetical protein JTB14_010382 [Gonioctena quinquepunctata]
MAIKDFQEASSNRRIRGRVRRPIWWNEKIHSSKEECNRFRKGLLRARSHQADYNIVTDLEIRYKYGGYFEMHWRKTPRTRYTKLLQAD